MSIPRNALFGRTAKLQIGTTVINFTGQGGLRIVFHVSKNPKAKESNTAKIQVYNLSPDSRTKVLNEFKHIGFVGPPVPGTDGGDITGVTLEAGYGGDIGRIFSGHATSVTNSRKGAEWVTEILAQDGLRVASVPVSLHIPKLQTLGQTVQKIAEELKKTVKDLDIQQVVKKVATGDFSGVATIFTRAATVSGMGMDQLDKLLRPIGVEISVQDGQLILMDVRGLRGGIGTAITLSDENGLVGTIDPVKDDKLPNVYIIKCHSLLRHLVEIGSAVNVQISTPGGVKGVFKVRKIEHEGDTHGREWFTIFEGVEIDSKPVLVFEPPAPQSTRDVPR